MRKEYMCYCGLYCGNCAVKAKVEPAALVLYDEMQKAGFEDVIDSIPGGGGFWAFLKEMAENGACTSCKEGGGNPGCAIRTCAEERGVEMCALCADYPCDLFDGFLERYPTLRTDNLVLREKGINAWAKMQDERRSKGFTYRDHSML
ncbi:MAG: DUF3795 domain-containing protein [Methanomassiliicoccaceae archaeon]|nr:DUF3795 domain-containing protein [Methanomassiliicoccaceae archaeon]